MIQVDDEVVLQVLDRDSGKYSFTVSSYMLELYQDELTDLFLPVPKQQGIQKVRTLFNPCLCNTTEVFLSFGPQMQYPLCSSLFLQA